MPSRSERPNTRGASASSSRIDSSPYPKPASRPSRRNAGGDADDSEGASGGGHHTPHVRSTRQQYSACGACRMRRVKCDLKEMAVTVAQGIRPVCTNCAERQINCVDEFSTTGGKPGKQKLLRRGRRIQNAEATFGKVDSPGEPPSIIPELSLEFFSSPLFLTFQVQRPILEPTEFQDRYAAHVGGDTQALGPAGSIIAKVLVVWAASFGHNEAGQPTDGSRSPFGADGLELTTRRAEWGAHVREMVDEVLRSVDRHGLLRKPSWDGVRALMLLLPLLVESSQTQLERLAILEATLSQIYTLSSLAPPPLAGQDGMLDILVRARIFWSAFVTEGITSGLRGGRLILDDDDLIAFQRIIPRDHPSESGSPSIPTQLSLLRRCSDIVIDISRTCRTVHRVLTGPRVRQRSSPIEEASLKGAWDTFEDIWNRLEDARVRALFEPLHGDDSDRFISSWQIYIFEAYNVIREVLKQRVLALETPIHSTTDSQAAHQQLIRLHEQALTICYAKLPPIMDLIRKYDPRGPNRHFFAYDASVSGDGCFFAAILLATGDSHRFGTTEAELRGDVDSCIGALRAMRWCFSKSEDRERSIEHEWNRRQQRLEAHAPPGAGFPSGSHYPLGMPGIAPPAAGSVPPLTVPGYRDQSSAAWSGMPLVPHTTSDQPFLYGSYNHPSGSYPNVVHLGSPPGSAGSRPSTGGGLGHDAPAAAHRGMVGSYNNTHALNSQFYVGSPVESSAHGSIMVPRAPQHGLGLPLTSSSSAAGIISGGLGQEHGQGAHHGFGDLAPATSVYSQWHSMHPSGPHH